MSLSQRRNIAYWFLLLAGIALISMRIQILHWNIRANNRRINCVIGCYYISSFAKVNFREHRKVY